MFVELTNIQYLFNPHKFRSKITHELNVSFFAFCAKALNTPYYLLFPYSIMALPTSSIPVRKLIRTIPTFFFSFIRDF
jgi:hypothetical protein